MNTIASPFLARFTAVASRAKSLLDRLPYPVFIAFAVLLALGISLMVLSPRLYLLLGRPEPNTFEWNRALNFLKQVQDPFHAEVEPALRWRLAPALLGRLLHLPGYTAFLVPWAGLLAALSYTTALAESRLRNRLDALLLVVLVGTLAAVQSITMAQQWLFTLL